MKTSEQDNLRLRIDSAKNRLTEIWSPKAAQLGVSIQRNLVKSGSKREIYNITSLVNETTKKLDKQLNSLNKSTKHHLKQRSIGNFLDSTLNGRQKSIYSKRASVAQS